MDHEYGVRWTEAVGRNMETRTKERFFPTAEKRTKFCEKLEQNSSFLEFLAWSEPRREVV